ncbi:hypothetical protein [Actinomadura opuntiae]|uniref:hypothetical protein n=1 Tax=Actinomadura sp. OS1-43 TaxID=604315 RepID=UPI00255ABB40|nr:hypothetical protein [Actinomadura sp. OS1-43]MDL4815006.1 hypothetical protein [Actinomadura sp. OS1-43]
MATPQDLETTTAGAWFEGFARRSGEARNHWDTKVAYYEATRRALTDHPGRPLSHNEIFEALACAPVKSTYYQVAGNNAKNPLIGWYAKAGERGAAIARAFAPPKGPWPVPVHELVNEAKAWTYWRGRPGWLESLRRLGRTGDVGGTVMTRTLLGVVAEWAVSEPALASALDDGPPVCAVEDLLVIRNWEPTVEQARGVLRQVVRDAARLGEVNGYVIDGAEARLEGPRMPDHRELQARLSNAIMEIQDSAPGMPPRIRLRIVALMRDAVDELAAYAAEHDGEGDA